tara:strand:+ start:377 stop:640 length:264 start_codon:yes stop_codon:yes gene_type:complete
MDQINNLQGGSPKPIARPTSPSKTQGVQEESDKAELSFEALVARLQEMPEIRVEAVEKGRELVDNPNYPGEKALRTLAQNLISQRIV